MLDFFCPQNPTNELWAESALQDLPDPRDMANVITYEERQFWWDEHGEYVDGADR
jgi:hypothetical protein